MRQILDGLKIPGKVSYLDKAGVVLLHLQAQIYADTGDLASAKDSLLKAYHAARLFDAAPVYTMENIRFYHGTEPLLLSDSFGPTAIQGLENSILQGTGTGSGKLRELWREITDDDQ